MLWISVLPNAPSLVFDMASIVNLRKWCKEVAGGVADKIRISGDTVVFEREYFYRHGKTSYTFAMDIEELVGSKLVLVDHEDRFNSWPKRSYFKATFRIKDSNNEQ